LIEVGLRFLELDGTDGAAIHQLLGSLEIDLGTLPGGPSVIHPRARLVEGRLAGLKTRLSLSACVRLSRSGEGLGMIVPTTWLAFT
jgi:hypothetical protein